MVEQKNTGFVFIFILTLTFIISLMAFFLKNYNIDLTKVSRNYQAQLKIREDLWQKIAQKEKQVEKGILAEGVTKIKTDLCGVDFYKILATENIDEIGQTAESFYAIVHDDDCPEKVSFSSGRLAISFDLS